MQDIHLGRSCWLPGALALTKSRFSRDFANRSDELSPGGALGRARLIVPRLGPGTGKPCKETGAMRADVEIEAENSHVSGDRPRVQQRGSCRTIGLAAWPGAFGKDARCTRL